VFEHVNGAVAEHNQTASEISDNAASASHFIVSVGDSAAEIDMGNGTTVMMREITCRSASRGGTGAASHRVQVINSAARHSPDPGPWRAAA
jgi:hypothetical protein